jgi:PTS system, glucose subfamily, IIA component
MDYRQTAKEVLDAIGGKGNIVSAAHCATRLRLVIADNAKCSKEALEDVDGVKGVFEASGQLQIIFGTGVVNKVYEEFVSLAGISAASKEDVKQAAAAKTNVFQQLIKTLGDIFVPIIPAIVASGLLMGIMNTLDYLINTYGWNIDRTSSVYVFANMFSNTAYTFLPILIGFSAAKVFGGNQFLGAVIGMIMIHPSLTNAWSVASMVANGEAIPKQSVFFGLWQIESVGYQGHVIPIMISVWVMCEIEKRLHKVVPAAIDLFVTPLVSIFVAGYLALAAVGPVFVFIENAILDKVQQLITIPFGIGSFIMGIFYAPTVVMGIHHMYTIIDLGQIDKYGLTFWLPLASACNIAQGAACLAVGVKTSDKKLKGLSFPASLSAFLGITEPAIFGVNLRYLRPFIAGCIGGACGAMYASIVHLGATATGVTGIFGILLCLHAPLSYIIMFAISMAVAFAVSWAITPASLIEGKKKEAAVSKTDTAAAEAQVAASKAKAAPEQPAVSEVASPLKGRIVPMEETQDQTFIAGILGKGIAVIPEDGVVIAPDDGSVVALMGHAVGFKLKNGVELIVHVGINTVNLNGKHYEAKVAMGDSFKKGDELLKFDIEAIKKEGYPIITPVIVTNSFEYKEIKAESEKPVTFGDKIFEVFR